jgi:hypothetical protein
VNVCCGNSAAHHSHWKVYVFDAGRFVQDHPKSKSGTADHHPA